MSNPTPETAAAGADASKRQRTVRHANLYLTRLEPWSVMKNAFMLSVAIAIVTLVAIMVLWAMLTISGTIAGVSRTVTDVAGESVSDVSSLLSFSRVMGTALLIGAIEIVLLSALATLFAYLYNLSVALTGGLHITLTDDH